MRTRRVRPWTITAPALAIATPAAAASEKVQGTGMWLVLFLAVGALVIAFQAVPALIMFGSILKALFAPAALRNRAGEEAGKTTRG